MPYFKGGRYELFRIQVAVEAERRWWDGLFRGEHPNAPVNVNPGRGGGIDSDILLFITLVKALTFICTFVSEFPLFLYTRGDNIFILNVRTALGPEHLS